MSETPRPKTIALSDDEICLCIAGLPHLALGARFQELLAAPVTPHHTIGQEIDGYVLTHGDRCLQCGRDVAKATLATCLLCGVLTHGDRCLQCGRDVAKATLATEELTLEVAAALDEQDSSDPSASVETPPTKEDSGLPVGHTDRSEHQPPEPDHDANTASPQDGLVHPAYQVYFRAGLIACREYMARFVEAQDPAIARSIRANWWPVLGKDYGPPRQLDWSEVAEGEYGTDGFRVRGADELSPTQEALPVALGFLDGGLPTPAPDPPATSSAPVTKTTRDQHIALNVRLRRMGVAGPACDGPGCDICAVLDELRGVARSGEGASSEQSRDRESSTQAPPVEPTTATTADGQTTHDGPCDGLGPGLSCAECAKSRFETVDAWILWLRSSGGDVAVVAEAHGRLCRRCGGVEFRPAESCIECGEALPANSQATIANSQPPSVSPSLPPLQGEELHLTAEWLRTPANINALPNPLRHFIHQLETNADPAGDQRNLIIARDTIAQLQALIAESSSSLRQELQALIAELRDEDRMAGLESERRANEGDQVQRNRCIGLSAGYRDAADRLAAVLLQASTGTEGE